MFADDDKARGWFREIARNAALDLDRKLLARLGGFDPRVLAAQAQRLSQEEAQSDRSIDSLLYIPGTKREVDGWNGVADPQGLAERLTLLLAENRFGQRLAWRALLDAPQCLDLTTPLLERLEGLTTGWRRRDAGLVLLVHEKSLARAQEFAASDDPFLRQAAATWAAASLSEDPRTRPVVLDLLADRDREVRCEALSYLRRTELDPDLLAAVRVSATGAEGWRCDHCGSDNDTSSSACANCNLNAATIDELVADLVDT